MDNNFDPILYSVGDKVIAKNKSPNLDGNIPKEEEIINVENIEFNTNKVCQILYFASNPKSFELAINFEPSNVEDKRKYYDIIEKTGFTTHKSRVKGKSTPKVVKPKTQREMNIKNFLKDN